mmetsp:Transcript_10761/g.15995  ORF Transcript_10761/g.15995 Transcript_10761/m.15995 type:complete len:277 (-) Transcript_10761:12-842(-)
MTLLSTSSTTTIRRCVGACLTSSSQRQRKITTLIIGSGGCLGSAIAKHFHNDKEHKIIGADIHEQHVHAAESASTSNDTTRCLSHYIQLPRTNVLENSVRALHRGFEEISGEQEGIDVIICAAGGWMPGSGPIYGHRHNNTDIDMDGYLTYASNTHKLLQQNLYPVIAASSLAAKKLNPNGLFVATGALAALSPTPGMEGYGLAKAAVHHLIQSMGKTSAETMAQLNQTYLGVLPGVLDTPSNRKGMNVGDGSSPVVPDDWVRPEEIAVEIGSWVA